MFHRLEGATVVTLVFVDYRGATEIVTLSHVTPCVPVPPHTLAHHTHRSTTAASGTHPALTWVVAFSSSRRLLGPPPPRAPAPAPPPSALATSGSRRLLGPPLPRPGCHRHSPTATISSPGSPPPP
jgi:hypothetical protein